MLRIVNSSDKQTSIKELLDVPTPAEVEQLGLGKGKSADKRAKSIDKYARLHYQLYQESRKFERQPDIIHECLRIKGMMEAVVTRLQQLATDGKGYGYRRRNIIPITEYRQEARPQELRGGLNDREYIIPFERLQELYNSQVHQKKCRSTVKALFHNRNYEL